VEYKDRSCDGVREELFEMLVRAKFTGNIIPFARVVHRALGPGAFRALGKARTAEEFSEIVESFSGRPSSSE
jgi:hypothetical protein